MTISLYAASVPSFQVSLKALKGILQKADAHAVAAKVDASVYLQARLYPNMFPLVRQVQITCDFAKGCAARLAGIDMPKFDDNEATFADLQARIDKTLEFLGSVQPGQIDGQEGRDIEIKAGTRTLNFKGQGYLTGFVLPNFYFHATTAYAILRHSGVEIGKGDFLGM
jgi:uncharacterized protein